MDKRDPTCTTNMCSVRENQVHLWILWTKRILLVQLICSVIEKQSSFVNYILLQINPIRSFLLGRHDSPLMHPWHVHWTKYLVMFSLNFKAFFGAIQGQFPESRQSHLYSNQVSNSVSNFQSKKGLLFCVKKKKSKSSDFGASFLFSYFLF